VEVRRSATDHMTPGNCKLTVYLVPDPAHSHRYI
jgi:hypothetical protein